MFFWRKQVRPKEVDGQNVLYGALPGNDSSTEMESYSSKHVPLLDNASSIAAGLLSTRSAPSARAPPLTARASGIRAGAQTSRYTFEDDEHKAERRRQLTDLHSWRPKPPPVPRRSRERGGLKKLDPPIASSSRLQAIHKMNDKEIDELLAKLMIDEDERKETLQPSPEALQFVAAFAGTVTPKVKESKKELPELDQRLKVPLKAPTRRPEAAPSRDSSNTAQELNPEAAPSQDVRNAADAFTSAELDSPARLDAFSSLGNDVPPSFQSRPSPVIIEAVCPEDISRPPAPLPSLPEPISRDRPRRPIAAPPSLKPLSLGLALGPRLDEESSLSSSFREHLGFTARSASTDAQVSTHAGASDGPTDTAPQSLCDTPAPGSTPFPQDTAVATPLPVVSERVDEFVLPKYTPELDKVTAILDLLDNSSTDEEPVPEEDTEELTDRSEDPSICGNVFATTTILDDLINLKSDRMHKFSVAGSVDDDCTETPNTVTEEIDEDELRLQQLRQLQDLI